MSNKLVSSIALTVFALATAACLLAAGAGAQLTPMSYGFPTIVQSNNAVAFNQDTADAVSFEDASISFPFLGGGLPFGGVSLAFPSIHQTSLETQTVTHTSFVQTSDFAEFAYPFISMGPNGLPIFGF